MGWKLSGDTYLRQKDWKGQGRWAGFEITRANREIETLEINSDLRVWNKRLGLEQLQLKKQNMGLLGHH